MEKGLRHHFLIHGAPLPLPNLYHHGEMCIRDRGTPRIIWGVEDIVLCAGKEEPFQFFEDVIAEVAPLFPGEYFHIGGDECPKTSWEKCPLCQARIRKEGLDVYKRQVLTTTPHNLSYPSFMITLKLNFRGIAYLPASCTRELNRVISTRQTWQSVDI